MAYRNDIDARDRGGAIAAVVAIHAALLFALLHLSGRIDLTDPQTVMKTFDFRTPPTPPPPPPRVAKPKEREGGSAPKNIRSEATPVVAPLPKIETPPLQKITAAETPRQGTAPTQGASDVRGRARVPAAAATAPAAAAAATDRAVAAASPTRRT